jgi:hypothetical protein
MVGSAAALDADWPRPSVGVAGIRATIPRGPLSKNLTRRANHRHIFIIARILEPAPGNWPRAFSIGRRPHSQRSLSSSHVSALTREASQARCRPSLYQISRHARTCRRGVAKSTSAGGPAAPIRHADRAWRGGIARGCLWARQFRPGTNLSIDLANRAGANKYRAIPCVRDVLIWIVSQRCALLSTAFSRR